MASWHNISNVASRMPWHGARQASMARNRRRDNGEAWHHGMAARNDHAAAINRRVAAGIKGGGSGPVARRAYRVAAGVTACMTTDRQRQRASGGGGHGM